MQRCIAYEADACIKHYGDTALQNQHEGCAPLDAIDRASSVCLQQAPCDDVITTDAAS
jgi:hypothetical protein